MNTSQYGCFIMGRLYTRDFFARFSVLNEISGDMHTTTIPYTVIEFLTNALQQDEKWLSIIIAHLEELHVPFIPRTIIIENSACNLDVPQTTQVPSLQNLFLSC
jgi:hypothetical protein